MPTGRSLGTQTLTALTVEGGAVQAASGVDLSLTVAERVPWVSRVSLRHEPVNLGYQGCPASLALVLVGQAVTSQPSLAFYLPPSWPYVHIADYQ